MSKAETAEKFFETYNCAQSVLSAYAADYDLDKNKALQVAVGFGAGMTLNDAVIVFFQYI